MIGRQKKLNMQYAGSNYYSLYSRKHNLPTLPETLANLPANIKQKNQIAMDSVLGHNATCLGSANHALEILGCMAVPQFVGYGTLLALSQNPLIMQGVEIISDECIKKGWCIERTTNEDIKSNIEVQALENDFEKFEVKKILKTAGLYCCNFGGAQIHPIIEDANIELPLILKDKLYTPGRLQGFTVIEPILTTAVSYNTTNPLAKDYYLPTFWNVQGIRVHHSRLFQMNNTEVSTILKPFYNFFGISTIQQVLDALAHFTQVNEAVARLVTKFSLIVFKTDMKEIYGFGNFKNEGTPNVDARLRYFAEKRDNDWVAMIDNDMEDIISVNTPLSGVDKIQEQEKTILASAFRIPDVKYWGISPGGLNATGDSDFKNYYDTIESRQEKIYKPVLMQMLKLIQLDRYGEIDPTISIKFNPLSEEDEQKVALIQKTKMETYAGYLDRGVVTGAEVRKELIDDTKAGFNDLESSEEANCLTDEERAILQQVFRNG